jgi:hypothetical protein
MKIFGIDLPFSFVIDQFSQSYNHPFSQFGISPTYKWVKVHLGNSNIQLSQIASAGHGFNGIGIELNPKQIRFSAFYGRLNLTGNDDTVSSRYERPKYSGVGYGVKLGIGSVDNYIDLSYFHGRDDGSSSLNNTQKPLENAVIGMDFKVRLLKVASLTGSFAVSGSTKDQPVENNDPKSGKSPSKSRGIFSTYNSGNIPAWALESAFSIDLKNFRSLLSYRKVRSDFISLGTPGTLNNGQTITLNSGLSLAKGKLNINATMVQQRNDENTESAGQLNMITGDINMNATLSDRFNFNLDAKGYKIKQNEGTLFLSDDKGLDQQIFQINFSPVYRFLPGKDDKTLNGNFNIGLFYDKNPLTGPSNQNKNLSASLTYDWVRTEKTANLSLTASYNRFVQSGSLSSSLGATVGAGTHLFKNKKLNLIGSLGYAYNSNNPGDSKGNITLSCNAIYRPDKNSFTFFVNYNVTPHDTRYGMTDYLPYKTTTNKLSAGITYTSSF